MTTNTSRPVPRFILLYLAYFTSLVGSWTFRIGVIVGLLHHNESALGLGVAVIFGPLIFGSLFLAPLADRADQLRLMIVLDFVRAVAMVPLLVSPSVDSPTTYLMIALLSITQPVFNAAQVAFIRATREPEQMVTVFRNLCGIEWLTYVVGMASGAVLLAHFSLSMIFVVNAVSYMTSAILIVLLRQSVPAQVPQPVQATPQGGLSDMLSLRTCFAGIFLLNLGAGIINMYPAVKIEVDHLGSYTALSTMIVMNGVFGLLGTLCVKSIYSHVGALKSMTLASGMIAIWLALMALKGGFLLAVGASSLMLGTGQIFAVSAQTHMIASVPAARAGKLAGLFQFCTFGGITLNGLLFAAVSNSLSFDAIVVCCAAFAVAAFVIGLGDTLRASTPAHAVAPTIQQ